MDCMWFNLKCEYAQELNKFSLCNCCFFLNIDNEFEMVVRVSKGGGGDRKNGRYGDKSFKKSNFFPQLRWVFF